MPFLYCAPYFLSALFAIFIVNSGISIGTSKLSKYSHLIIFFYFVIFEFCHLVPLPSSESANLKFTLSMILLLLFFSTSTIIWIYSLNIANTSSFKQFLSAQFFVPFSRLSYGIYLLNLLVIWFNAHQARKPMTLTGLSIVNILRCIDYTYK